MRVLVVEWPLTKLPGLRIDLVPIVPQRMQTVGAPLFIEPALAEKRAGRIDAEARVRAGQHRRLIPHPLDDLLSRLASPQLARPAIMRQKMPIVDVAAVLQDLDVMRELALLVLDIIDSPVFEPDLLNEPDGGLVGPAEIPIGVDRMRLIVRHFRDPALRLRLAELIRINGAIEGLARKAFPDVEIVVL